MNLEILLGNREAFDHLLKMVEITMWLSLSGLCVSVTTLVMRLVAIGVRGGKE